MDWKYKGENDDQFPGVERELALQSVPRSIGKCLSSNMEERKQFDGLEVLIHF